jgi:hypothetical protein
MRVFSSTALVITLLSLVTLASAQPPAPIKPAPAPAKMPTKPPVKKVAPPKPLPAGVLMRVNGVEVKAVDLQDLFMEWRGGRQLTQALLQKTLIEQEAARLKVTVSDVEVAKKVKEEKDRIVAQAMMQGGEPQTFQEFADKNGLAEGELVFMIRMNLLARKAFSKAAESRVPTMDNMVNWAHIIVQVNQLKADGTTMTPEEVVKANDEAKAKLEGILADIKAKKITFEAAAKQFSQDGAGQRGGELGMLDPRSLDADFTKAGNLIAKAGDITGPIKSQFGWHLIKLIKRGKDASAIEKAQYKRNLLDQIANNQQELQGWVTSLLSKAKIERNGEAVTSLGSAPVATPKPKTTTTKPKAAVKSSRRSGR